nr:bacteriocin [Flavobacterium sp. ASV13]
MKNKTTPTTNTAKTATLKNFTPLSKKQLETITGGEDPKTSRGTKTSIGT